MKKIILAVAASLMLATVADAHTGKRPHKKHRKHAKPTYYYNSDGTINQGKTADERRSSPYKGDNVPENDGAKKNEHRNLNNNSGQALPANNGK